MYMWLCVHPPHHSTSPAFTFRMQDIYLTVEDGGLKATILTLTSNARLLCSAECHMVNCWGQPSYSQELITALCSPLELFLVSYRSWKLHGGLASHGSAKTQRGGWQLLLGGVALSSQTSGCGLLMHVASGLLHQGIARAWKRARVYVRDAG